MRRGNQGDVSSREHRCALFIRIVPLIAIVLLLRPSAPLVAGDQQQDGHVSETPKSSVYVPYRVAPTFTQTALPERTRNPALSDRIALIESFLQFHPEARPVVLRSVLVEQPDTMSLNGSLIRPHVVDILKASTLNPLEAAMLRNYQLYGTYYAPPNKDMDKLEIPLTDVLNIISKVF